MLIHGSLALYSWIFLHAYEYCFLGLLDFLACSSSSHPLQTGFLSFTIPLLLLPCPVFSRSIHSRAQIQLSPIK